MTAHTKSVAGYEVPVGISDELAAGLVVYRAQIDAIGWYGTRIRVTMPDGAIQVGALDEAGSGGAQPIVRCDNGRRYRISDLRAVTRAEAR